MFPVLKLVYTICSLVYTYSFSSIFNLYFICFYLFGIFMQPFCIFICIYTLFDYFLPTLCTFQLVLHYVFIMFSSLYSKKNRKTSKKFSKKVLTLFWSCVILNTTKGKQPKLSINTQKVNIKKSWKRCWQTEKSVIHSIQLKKMKGR